MVMGKAGEGRGEVRRGGEAKLRVPLSQGTANRVLFLWNVVS